jgi:uncharacterized protein YjbI with pentapeptide repeats
MTFYRARRRTIWDSIVSNGPALAALVTALVALAAVIISIFSFRATSQSTERQLRITDQGQITDRYNAAITDLADGSIDIRLGGIYALQRLMHDSTRDQSTILDQPTIIAVLCAFVRDQSSKDAKPQDSPASSVPTDVQAALTAIGTRNLVHDGPKILIDLNHALLADAQLGDLRLDRANLSGAVLSGANLISTHLGGANLSGAKLTKAHLTDPGLSGASFSGANLRGALLVGAIMPKLSFATAILRGTDLSGAILTYGYFVGAELADAKLVNADLCGADFTGAELRGADVRQADLTGANLSYADLTGAKWPLDATVPEGWQRKSASSNLLERSRTTQSGGEKIKPHTSC